jgi:hypothetical protein
MMFYLVIQSPNQMSHPHAIAREIGGRTQLIFVPTCGRAMIVVRFTIHQVIDMCDIIKICKNYSNDH